MRTHEPKCVQWAQQHEGWQAVIREGERGQYAFTTAPASMLSIIEKLRKTADTDVRTHAKNCFAETGVSDAEGFAAMLATAEIVAQADSKHMAKKGERPHDQV